MKTKEQKLYVKSFEIAMKDVDDAIKLGTKQLPENKEIKDMNGWDARWLASQYVLCTGKMCQLSKRLREYIMSLGDLAMRHYETLTKDESKED